MTATATSIAEHSAVRRKATGGESSARYDRKRRDSRSIDVNRSYSDYHIE